MLTFAISARAQALKRFRIEAGNGLAAPSGTGYKTAMIFYVEPSVNLSDFTSLGLRLEHVQPVVINRTNIRLVPASLLSYMINVQHYLTKKPFRPYVGIGFGLYYALDHDQDDNSVNPSPSQLRLGFYPRIGFDIHHFTCSLDYNVVPNTEHDLFDVEEIKRSYVSLRAGVRFGLTTIKR
jgi:hypothetical protein